MKEMIYKAEHIKEVLDNGTISGYDYVIMNYGFHPCAYVKLKNENCEYGNLEDYYWVDVHGGITFAQKRDFGFGEHFYIGWDYGHCGDYSGTDLLVPKEIRTGGKHWTTEEMLGDVKDVIKQLKEK